MTPPDDSSRHLLETVARLSLKARIFERLLCMVGSGAPSPRIWSDILDAAMEAVPCEASSFFLADAQGGLEIVAARGRVSDKVMGLKLKRGTGVAGACLSDRRTIPVSDVSRDPRHAAAFAQALGFETRSLVAVPVLHDGAALGVIEIVNKAGTDDFPRHEVELLERIAKTAGDLLAQRGLPAPARSGKRKKRA